MIRQNKPRIFNLTFGRAIEVENCLTGQRCKIWLMPPDDTRRYSSQGDLLPQRDATLHCEDADFDFGFRLIKPEDIASNYQKVT